MSLAVFRVIAHWGSGGVEEILKRLLEPVELVQRTLLDEHRFVTVRVDHDANSVSVVSGSGTTNDKPKTPLCQGHDVFYYVLC